MPKYEVEIPLVGHAFVEIQAGNEEEAVDVAIEAVFEHCIKTNDYSNSTAGLYADVIEINAIDKYHEGGVCLISGPWELQVEEVDDDEEWCPLEEKGESSE